MYENVDHTYSISDLNGLSIPSQIWFYNTPMHLHRVSTDTYEDKVIHFCTVCGWEKTELSTENYTISA